MLELFASAMPSRESPEYRVPIRSKVLIDPRQGLLARPRPTSQQVMTSVIARAPRLDLSFPLLFCSEGEWVSGHCLNLSSSGLLGTFQQALDLWTMGELTLMAGEEHCIVTARVARVSDKEAGLAFQYRQQAERDRVERLLAVAARATHLVGAPPF